MTPRERAQAIVKAWPVDHRTEHWVNVITTAIQAAISDQTAALQAAREELARVKQERGGLAAAIREYRKWYNVCGYDLSAPGKLDAACAASAGLDMALKASCQKCSGHGKVGYQDVDDYPCLEDCPDCKGARQILAAHDRQVAARVLREVARPYPESAATYLLRVAAEYERGEREVKS